MHFNLLSDIWREINRAKLVLPQIALICYRGRWVVEAIGVEIFVLGGWNRAKPNSNNSLIYEFPSGAVNYLPATKLLNTVEKAFLRNDSMETGIYVFFRVALRSITQLWYTPIMNWGIIGIIRIFMEILIIVDIQLAYWKYTYYKLNSIGTVQYSVLKCHCQNLKLTHRNLNGLSNHILMRTVAYFWFGGSSTVLKLYILVWYFLNCKKEKRWRNTRNLPRLYSTTFITSYQPNLSQEASLFAGFVFEIW